MNRDAIIRDIKAVTFYDDKVFIGKTDNQLYAMRCRIFTDMDRYYREIYKYFHEHPEERIMDDQDLKQLNYNELADLRKRLGLGKKKVKSSVNASDVASKAKKVVHDMEPKQLTLDIIFAQDAYEEREMFLYREEIEQMGYEDYSEEDLRKMGIIPLEKENHLKK